MVTKIMLSIHSCIEFKERNAKVAQKWAELSEDERKQWALKAEATCASSLQVRE